MEVKIPDKALLALAQQNAKAKAEEQRLMDMLNIAASCLGVQDLPACTVDWDKKAFIVPDEKEKP